MKQALSISIGSLTRNKSVVINLLGEDVHIERIGTNGDMDAARQMFKDMDGKVDAFGVGGTDLGLFFGGKWHPFHSVLPIVQDVRHTPIVDGLGLKNTLEVRSADILESEISSYLNKVGRSVLVTTAVDRYGLVQSFINANYKCTFGDALFSLGLPLPLHSEKQVNSIFSILMPIVSRLPFEWVYPTGEKQLERKPKFTWAFEQASVIAGDCQYITRYMPDDLEGKIVVTNTTTPRDIDLFKQAGVKYLLTTTPVYDGRSFGTNMMEAALLAVTNYKGKVDYRNFRPHFKRLAELIDIVGFKPALQVLN